ncbi:hypothetical protein ACFWYW_49370 [Nonomuraea sp. NPDC059023]|uniref:DUF7873 family protein n=1 Tax=unclassified Nonomuraea TaxID=2593643 RepID=UPI0036949EFA
MTRHAYLYQPIDDEGEQLPPESTRVQVQADDPAETWSQDVHTEAWRTEPVKTTRTKKVPRNHVLAEATDKHPAQVQVFTEDIVVGYWTKVAFSGALPQRRVNELLARVQKLQDAVKFAREEANGADIVDRKIGEKVFSYLLG